MAEVLRADRSSFSRLDDLVNYPLVRLWLYWGMFWLLFTPTFGVTISAMFNFPDYLGTSEYLTFGRLRPVHVNGVIFGAFSTLFFGLCYYLVPRLCGVWMHAESLGYWMAWLWNIVVAMGLLSLPLGYNQGLEAGEFPFLVDVLLLVVFALMTWQVTTTVAQRVEPQLYVSLWYLLASLWWTTINMMLGALILPSTPG